MSLAAPRSPLSMRRRGGVPPAWQRYFASLRPGVVGSPFGAEAEADAGGGTGVGYWAPVTNGDPVSPELLYDSHGDVVMGFVTL